MQRKKAASITAKKDRQSDFVPSLPVLILGASIVRRDLHNIRLQNGSPDCLLVTASIRQGLRKLHMLSE